MGVPHKYLVKEFEDFGVSASAESLMQYVSERIHLHVPRYNWVGFYLLDKTDSCSLVLGPHTGSFTPKAKISFDEGLCGVAASMGRVMVADNVAVDPRYIQACDMVKSQISVPMLVRGKVRGVFHVESYFLASFKPDPERKFVEKCADIVAKCLQGTAALDFVNA